MTESQERDLLSPISSALQAAKDALDADGRIEAGMCTELVAEIASQRALPEDGILLGAAGLSLAFALLRSMLATGDGGEVKLVVPESGMEGYADLARRLRVHCARVPLTRDGHQDLDALAAAGSSGRALLVLSNPQDPTGMVLPGDDLRRFLRETPVNAMVLLDETNAAFVRDPRFLSGEQMINRHPHLVVVRGLSVVHGLRGLRLAYAACDPEVAEAMQRQILPHEVNAVAQSVALASLRAAAAIRERTDTIIMKRDRIREKLRVLGFQVPPSETNGLWLPLGASSEEFAALCYRMGVDVRLSPGAGIGLNIDAGLSEEHLLHAASRFAMARTAGKTADLSDMTA